MCASVHAYVCWYNVPQDVDIIWLRNPLLRIPIGADMAMSCDFFGGDNPYDLNKLAN